MIDIDRIRNDFDGVVANLARRGVPQEAVTAVAKLDSEWRLLTQSIESIRAQKNEANQAIAKASPAERAALIAQMQTITAEEKTLGQTLAILEVERDAAWRKLPNLVADGVPEGTAEHFTVIAESAIRPSAKPHSYLTLGEPRLIDLERGAKVSGSRFVYLKGELARLELALVSFIFDLLTPAGFTGVIPPVLVGQEAMRGMGYLDHEGDEVYRTQDDLYLVGTSEQALGPMHMNETLEEAALPLRYLAYSSCFRREAGSHGKDVHGILRLHQFNKVEMVSFTTPEQSTAEHEFLLAQARKIMDALELPYRVILIASQDLGAPAAKKYDIETWIPSENTYRETHSTSNTTDYQSRRLNIRYKSQAGRVGKAHILNGTALAMSRAMIAILENHQQADGSVTMPAALAPYLPFTTIQPQAK